MTKADLQPILTKLLVKNLHTTIKVNVKSLPKNKQKIEITKKKKIDNWQKGCFAEFGEFIGKSESLKYLYMVWK